MEKVAQDQIKSKIGKIEASVVDSNHKFNEEIKTIKSNVESAKNKLTAQIEQANVSFVLHTIF